MTTVTQFGPDTALSGLNASFRACLAPGLSPAQQKDCDDIVGGLDVGRGFCGPPTAQNPTYARMTYCACVNSPVPCPMLAATSCANSAVAYRRSPMLAGGQAFQACKNTTICVNTVAVGGSQNVVRDITQQCGSIQNIENVISASPSLAAISFILFIVLVLLILARGDDGEPAYYGPVPPPPDFVLPR